MMTDPIADMLTRMRNTLLIRTDNRSVENALPMTREVVLIPGGNVLG